MYLKYFFKDTNNTYRHRFKTTNNFTPPIPDNIINLLHYISLVLRDIKTNTNHNTTRLQDNLSHALTSLHKKDELIVKPADKRGAIVIWPRELYFTEAYKQLKNNLHYKLIQNEPFPTLIKNINQFTNTTYKADVPGRPIISGCDGPTARLSEYADHFLKPLMIHIKSYVKDSTNFLRRIFSLNDKLPANIILLTIDVKSLYTNIPNDEGIKASMDVPKIMGTST